MASLPAIQPVPTRFKRLASGYGYRIDPIYKVNKMHWGTDFSIKIWNPGLCYRRRCKSDGQDQILVGTENRLKSTMVLVIERNMPTLSEFVVKKGQKVKRG